MPETQNSLIFQKLLRFSRSSVVTYHWLAKKFFLGQKILSFSEPRSRVRALATTYNPREREFESRAEKIEPEFIIDHPSGEKTLKLRFLA